MWWLSQNMESVRYLFRVVVRRCFDVCAREFARERLDPGEHFPQLLEAQDQVEISPPCVTSGTRLIASRFHRRNPRGPYCWGVSGSFRRPILETAVVMPVIGDVEDEEFSPCTQPHSVIVQMRRRSTLLRTVSTWIVFKGWGVWWGFESLCREVVSRLS